MRLTNQVYCNDESFTLQLNASLYRYTRKAQIAGTVLSSALLAGGLYLSFLPNNAKIGSGGSNALIVVLLYAGAILTAALFAERYPVDRRLQSVLGFLGKASLPIYMSHTFVEKTMAACMDMTGWHKEYMLMMVLGTAAASGILELLQRGLVYACRAACSGLKAHCIEGLREEA